jgi:hypothetical protein
MPQIQSALPPRRIVLYFSVRDLDGNRVPLAVPREMLLHSQVVSQPHESQDSPVARISDPNSAILNPNATLYGEVGLKSLAQLFIFTK